MAGSRVLLVLFVSLVDASRGEVGECQGEKVDKLFRGAVCEPVAAIVELRMPGEEFSDMLPKHAMVNRCSGSCKHSQFYECKPTNTSIVKVDVMLFSRSPGTGRTESWCTVASISQHSACTCGCLADASSCQNAPLKVWVQEECRCSCANQWEKIQCLRKGWHWNTDDCQCWCPNPGGYPLCSTSYYYDYLNTCSCDCNPQLAWCAPTIPQILVVIVLASTIGSVISVSACYRYKIGLFKSKKREHSREPPHLGRNSLPLGHRARSRTWTGKFSFKRPPRLSKVGPGIILGQNELVDEPLLESSTLTVNHCTSMSNVDLHCTSMSNVDLHCTSMSNVDLLPEENDPCQVVLASSEETPNTSGLNRMEKWGGLIRYKQENVNLEIINKEHPQNVTGHILKAEIPEEVSVTLVFPQNCQIQMTHGKPVE